MFPSVVCDHGTIIISGGFGGLGLTMSRWMVEEHGVKRIVLMSRRTLSELEQPDNPQYTDWLRLKQACLATKNTAHVEVVQVDVTKYDDVRDLFVRFSQTAYPIRGIIHSAVVSQDKLLSNLTPETLKLATDAKVRGAWNFHHAAHQTQAPLHFFIMFSSIRNHLIDFGSAGYNAGNEFLDALAHYRSKILNQPALSISLPAISGAGMFHRERDMLMQLYSSNGLQTVPTEITFELIDRFFINQQQCPCPIIFACNWKAMNALATKSSMVTYQITQLVDQQQMVQANTYSTAGTVQIGTQTMQVDEVVDRTQATVARLLGASSVERIATDRSLLAQGMDSLAGVSLYNWLGQYFGFFVPLTDILQGISIQVIAKYIFDKMEEQRQMATCVTQTNSTSMLSNNDNQKLSTNDSYSYTGMNNIIRIIQPRINSTTIQRIVFCIGMVNPSVEKTLLAQQSLLSASIYILQIPTGLSVAAETIAQMRRIQPRGPYSLVTVSKQGENIAHQIIKQLEEQHQQAGVAHFLAMTDPTPLEPLEQ
jgi:NADP-dependent 3-hydroxy acid dehydrogenase YdfG